MPSWLVVVDDTRPDRNALDLVLSPHQSADLLVERGEVTDCGSASSTARAACAAT
jgi:hypothetical protein